MHADGNVKWCSLFGKGFGSFYSVKHRVTNNSIQEFERIWNSHILNFKNMKRDYSYIEMITYAYVILFIIALESKTIQCPTNQWMD